jgi:hypothetical protein
MLFAGERYEAATVDDKQQLHIMTSDHREIIPKKKANQTGFDSPAISTDHVTVAWLALYPNCCTSYPIPLELIIFRDGRVARKMTGNGLPIFSWCFEADGTQVAFYQDTVHGNFGPHFELRDARSGRLIESYDGNPKPDAPRWVQDVPL